MTLPEHLRPLYERHRAALPDLSACAAIGVRLSLEGIGVDVPEEPALTARQAATQKAARARWAPKAGDVYAKVAILLRRVRGCA